MNFRDGRFWRSPPVILAGIVVVLWFSWHVLLRFILHALLILAEVLELAIDHLLENVLHLEGHSAQMYTAWIGVLVFTALAVYGFRWTRNAWVRRFQTWENFVMESEGWGKSHWLTWSLPLIVLMVLVILF